MVLSYNYSNRNRRRRRTNAPPSRAISMAIAVRRCNTASIVWWRRSRAFIKTTNHRHRATTRSVLPRRLPGRQSTEQRWYNVLPLLTILMAVAVRRYNTTRIAWWRRFMAFLKATKRRHRVSTHSDRIKGTSQCREFTIFFKSFRRRRRRDWSGWQRNLLGVWHINGKPRTWQMHGK